MIIKIIFLLLLSLSANAKNIDLSTIPSRDSVQLTIYNSEDLTLVRETRQVSIKKGLNKLQFSWANTQIDPTSVQLNFLTQADEVFLTNTTFPHDKPQMLYWNLQSSVETLLKVEISYFTSGITWQADYSAILDTAGQTMQLDRFIKVTNRSGEDYDNARIRLVIGKINLVERVNDLVRQAKITQNEAKKRNKSLRARAARPAMSKASGRYEMLTMSAEMDAVMDKEKEISKESLSEYYIFSIEGTESISNQWSKRLRSGYSNHIALETLYRYRPREYGDELVRVLSFKNDQAADLGDAPLPEGNLQIYQKNQQGSLTYIKGLTLKYTSVGDKVELNSGNDPDIYFELVNLKNWRDNIWMHYRKGNLHRRVGDGHIIIDHNSTVSGWNEHSLYVQRLKNFTDKPIKVEIRRVISGDSVVQSQHSFKQHDFQTVELQTTLASGVEQALLYEVLSKKGRNAQQNQVSIEKKLVQYPVW